MAFLHSHNIIHRNLNSSNIFFDDSFLPKITGLDFSKPLQQISPLDEPRKDQKYKGEKKFLAPEIFQNFSYSKKSDVYSFSLLMYELMTSQIAFDDFTRSLVGKGVKMHYDGKIQSCYPKFIIEGNRPKFDKEISPCYQKLIEKCWSSDPEERPSFDEIVVELKNNRDFITEEVDEKEFRDYIEFIEKSTSEFDEEKTIKEVDELLKSKSNNIKKSEINLDCRGKIDSDPVLDIKKYSKKADKFNLLAVDKETNMKFHVDSCSREINNFLRHEIINFARSVNIVSQLNHPAILKFIGYSPVDFNNQPNPICLTECFQSDCQNTNFNDDTLILIVLYGIASAMAYLHSHNILHRNLKLESILLDDYSLPKLYGFDIAKEINRDSTEPNEKIKGTPIYIAPEVYLNRGYSKASDVYSYSLILYELITGEILFEDLNVKEIKQKVAIEQERPTFDKPISECYRKLIEKCWSADPKSRPTFEEIVQELRSNPEFITESVEKESFLEYVEFLDDFDISFNQKRRIKQLDDILENKLNSFPDYKSSFHFYDMRKVETNNLIIDDECFLDLKDFESKDYIKDDKFLFYL